MAESKKPQSLARPEQEVVKNPLSLMRRMFEDMDDLFGYGRGARLQPMWNPDIEVIQREGSLVVRADLPGLAKEDVKVNVSGDELVIEGERRHEEQKEEGGIYHSERTYGSFLRRIPLPRGVDVGSCDANFENGVLEVKLSLPKQEKRQIDVKTKH
jgi:HSP20 family protein